MIKLTIGTNTKRNVVIVEGDKPLREILDANNVNYTSTVIHLDGMPLDSEDLDMTLEELDVTEAAYLVSVIKAENA